MTQMQIIYIFLSPVQYFLNLVTLIKKKKKNRLPPLSKPLKLNLILIKEILLNRCRAKSS